jgi:broad specificity phosphatase PhoE
MLSLYLIRHGQTEWSLSGQHTGRSDIPLTAQGEEEARGLIPGLSHVRFSRVFTSPRQRARRTCELAGLGEQAIVEPDLAEWDYGDYEGMRTMDIRRQRPDWSIFRDGCPAAKCRHTYQPAPTGFSRVSAAWTGRSRSSPTANSVLRWRQGGSSCRLRTASISRWGPHRSVSSAITRFTPR